MWENIKRFNVHVIWARKKKQIGVENIFLKPVETFLNSVKHINSQLHKTQFWKGKTKKPKSLTHTQPHYNQTAENQRFEKIYIFKASESNDILHLDVNYSKDCRFYIRNHGTRTQ